MKRYLYIILVLISFIILSSCGSDYAKIVGLYATISVLDDSSNYYQIYDDKIYKYKNNEYNADSTSDIDLNLDAKYLLHIDWVATGGSRYPVFTYRDIESIIYDDNIISLEKYYQNENYDYHAEYILNCCQKTSDSIMTIQSNIEYKLVFKINIL